VIDGLWLTAADADPRAVALYRRHYSFQLAQRKAKRGRAKSFAFIGPGEKMVLLTRDCDALFAWLRPLVERKDGQQGVCCTVFRNESALRASDLIREADDLAWARWPSEQRHFTFVHPGEVASEVPGYCFRRAGWKRCGVSKAGLLIFERVSARELAEAA
jgi:hypothetical protein